MPFQSLISLAFWGVKIYIVWTIISSVILPIFATAGSMMTLNFGSERVTFNASYKPDIESGKNETTDKCVTRSALTEELEKQGKKITYC